MAAASAGAAPLRTLLLDNYDSYTYNLYQLIAEVNGELPTVLRNDEVDWPTLHQRIASGEFHNIVISPGPGTPERPGDIGISLQLLQAQLPIPILGVCLGFQALALAHGGSVRHAPEPVHGRLSSVQHGGHPLFGGIPSGPAYAVVRYHSLLVEEASLPGCLQGIAWTCGEHHALQLGADGAAEGVAEGVAPDAVGGAADADSSAANGEAASQRRRPPTGADGGQRLLMALAHRSLPHYGVQFHPESVATGYGIALLRNFAALTCQHHGLSVPAMPPLLLAKLAGPPGSAMLPRPWDQQPQQLGNLRVHYQQLTDVLAAADGSEALFWHLFGSSSGNGAPGSAVPDSFWLDSATPDRGRFSFMGGRGGSLWRRIEYRLPPLPSAAEPANGRSGGNSSSTSSSGTLRQTAADGQRQERRIDFFSWLQDLLATHRCSVSPEDAAGLPFNFWGGLVGYLGYELKEQCGGRRAVRAGNPAAGTAQGTAGTAAGAPDAAFFLADQLLAVDHHTDAVYVLSLYEAGSAASQQEAQQWVAHTAARVQALAACGSSSGSGRLAAPRQAAEQQPPGGKVQQGIELPEPFRLREGKQRYLQNIGSCMQALYDGESYEVCLTTMLSRQGAPDAVQLYRTLRAINPAPYAAWLRFGAGGSAGGDSGGGGSGSTTASSADLQLCCCSPERFLKGDRGGQLEAKPIKGTAPRSADPKLDAQAAAELAGSEKDRAENLMIVDLLRNDLGRVCAPGSVHVPGLMQIESYATVHQMVSTVRGLRRPEASVVDCLRAAFPGGSMTGAPKIRTMDIIDQLEQGPRGVYSGSLGYISFNDTFDLNIVIRTAVLQHNRISIGAGGAIVVQSEPAGEYEEMRLKARALLRAVGMCDGTPGPAAVEEE